MQNDNRVKGWLKHILAEEIEDAFYGHRGIPGHRGGSLPRTEHTTKHTNSQFENEAGKGGFSIKTMMDLANEHKYTAKEHKQMQNRALVLISGDQIPGSKFKGMQLYRYNKKDKCLESSYGDNPKLYLKDLVGKTVRTFQPTSDTINKDTIHAAKKQRVEAAKQEDTTAAGISDKIGRLEKECPKPTSEQQHAVRWYTTNSGFKQMNKALRKEGAVNLNNGKVQSVGSDVELQKNVDNLSNFLGKAHLSQDTMLYRCCGIHGVEGVFGKLLEGMHMKLEKGNVDKCLKALVGKTGQEVGYMSTCVQKGGYGSSKKFRYEIFAPKGSNFAYIDKFSDFEGEQEAIGQRGMKLLLTGYKKDKKGRYTLQVQVVN